MSNSELKPLCEIGTEVEIDLSRVKDRFSNSLINKISKNAIGKVIDYKMTDAREIGLVVRFHNNKECWFFNHEIKAISTDPENNIWEEIQISDNRKFVNLSPDLNILVKFLKIKKAPVNKNIDYLVNPKAFVKWLIFSIKDIF